jgi:hypothetical protein
VLYLDCLRILPETSPQRSWLGNRVKKSMVLNESEILATDVHNGRDIILADDPVAFAQAVLILLRDPELRRRYEKAAAETAARYDWPAIGERFSAVLQSVAEKKSFALRALPGSWAKRKA